MRPPLSFFQYCPAALLRKHTKASSSYHHTVSLSTALSKTIHPFFPSFFLACIFKMRLFNDFLLYSALSMSVFHASLTHATPAAPSKAGGVFTTIPTPQKGNCDGYDVDTMISDAKTLAQNSINAINTLSGGGFLGLTYSESTHTLAQTAYVNWGVTYTTLIPGRIRIRTGLDTMSTAKGQSRSTLVVFMNTWTNNEISLIRLLPESFGYSKWWHDPHRSSQFDVHRCRIYICNNKQRYWQNTA